MSLGVPYQYSPHLNPPCPQDGSQETDALSLKLLPMLLRIREDLPI
ncbi:unnamed protein product [Spirodela intermedia]|uniref:Uncharacterized protein n=1 Tax=Spirodela intermedia TaxID=51605 RepID=A0A7I8KAH2_SPIIN|nr:unnamed protein product [Spirodela intermedia]